MAVFERTLSTGKTVFDVYVQGWNYRLGRRVQLKRRGFESRRQAASAENELRAELVLKRDEVERFTFAAWVEKSIATMKLSLRPSTVENYSGMLAKWVTPHLGQLELSEITAQDVHEVIYSRIAGVSPNTQRTVLKMIHRIFTMAIDQGLIAKNPARPIKVKVPQPKQSVLNATEAQRLLDEARALHHRFYPVWAVALMTGMRSGELYALRWSDIDLENRRISVTRSWDSKVGYGPTKTQRNRVVPISASLKQLLCELRLSAGRSSSVPGEDFVLPHLQEWTDGAQAAVLRDFCKAIGITSVKFHDLRATFITQLLLRGVPLAQVMAIVGHSQLKTTNVYLRVAGTDLQGATEKLSYTLPTEQLAQVIELSARHTGA